MSSLPRNQVPQWAASYIDYKGLKKLLKSVVIDSQEHGNDIDLAGGISLTPPENEAPAMS